MISSSNKDHTHKIELHGVQFKNNGEVIEGTVIFPRVYPTQGKSFEFLPEKEDSEVFTVYIPEQL
jgi:hypothetical protein